MSLEAGDILELLPGTTLNEGRVNLSTDAIESLIAAQVVEIDKDLRAGGYEPVEPWGDPKTCRDWLLEEIVISGVLGELLTSALVGADHEAQGYAGAFKRRFGYFRMKLVRTHCLHYALDTSELGELPTEPLTTADEVGAMTGILIETGAQLPPDVFDKVARRVSAVIYPLLALRGADVFSLTDDQRVGFGQLAAKLCAEAVFRAKSTSYARAILDGEANTARMDAEAIYQGILNGDYDHLIV